MRGLLSLSLFTSISALSCTTTAPTSITLAYTDNPPTSWYSSLADVSTWHLVTPTADKPAFPVSCSPALNCSSLYGLPGQGGEGEGEGEGGSGNHAGLGTNEACLLLRDELVWGVSDPSAMATGDISCEDGKLPTANTELSQFALHVVVSGPTKEARMWLNGKSYPLNRDGNTLSTPLLDTPSVLEQSSTLLVALRFLQDTAETAPLNVESVVLSTEWTDSTTTTTTVPRSTMYTRNTHTARPPPGTSVSTSAPSSTATTDANGTTAYPSTTAASTSSPNGPTNGDHKGKKTSHGTLAEVLVILAIVLGAIVAVGCALRAVRRARSRKQSEGFKLLLQDGEEFDDEDNGLFA
jgi:hypothetical protein